LLAAVAVAAVVILAGDTTTADWGLILSFGERWAVALAAVGAVDLRVDLGVVVPAIGVDLVAAVDSMEAVLVGAGKSFQNLSRPFFPFDCFVPLQIP
jgi:hypothetical protein